MSNQARDQTAQMSRAQVEGIAHARRIKKNVHSNTFVMQIGSDATKNVGVETPP